MTPYFHLSRYCVLVPVPGLGVTMTLNTLHHTSLVISEDTASRLAAGDLESLSDETAAALVDLGILTTDTPEEERRTFSEVLDERARQAMTAPPRAYLMPSYDCNLKCVYCFQHKIRRTTPSIHMSESTATAAFRYLSQAFEGSTSRGVTLYGGEPLTAKNRSIVEFICAEAARHDFSVMAATHAWNLDLYEELLGPGKIAMLHITVDGPAQIHNRLRIGPNHAETFDAIMAHVEMALRLGTRVRMRVNVDGRVLELLEEFAGDLADRGFIGHPLFSAYVAPMFATRTQVESGSQIATATLVTEFLVARKLAETPSLARVFEGYPPVYDGIAALVEGRSSGLGAGHCCYGARTVVLDPGGNLYPCVFLAGERDYAAGSYLSSDATEPNGGEEWIATGTRRCSVNDCKYALYCGGGSPYDSFARTDTAEEPSCVCADFAETFAGYARAAYLRGLAS